MIIGGIYSQNGGRELIESQYTAELNDIQKIITTIDSELYRTKPSKEKTKLGRMLYNPVSLNNAFKHEFKKCGWQSRKVYCEYSTKYYTS